MKENQAINQAMIILGKADERLLTEQDGNELEKLEKFIPEDKYSSLWSAFLTSSDQLATINPSD